MSKDRILL